MEKNTSEYVTENGGIAGYEPQFVDVDGIRTRYYDIGEGEPIVLVHGGNWSGSSNANTWWPNFEDLSEEYRVLAFDRLGCGMTDNPDEVEDFVYQSELDHAIGFLETVGAGPYHLVGSSRGGGLCTRIAVEDPDLVETLQVLNSGTLGPESGDSDYRYDRLFERWAPDVEPTDPEYTRFRYIQYSHQTHNITDEYCEIAAWLRGREKAQETARIMIDEGQQEVWEETMEEHMNETKNRIKKGILGEMPVHYIFGRNDITVRLETGIAAFDIFGQTNPNVRLSLLNDCGHIIYQEWADEFNQIVADFIERMT